MLAVLQGSIHGAPALNGTGSGGELYVPESRDRCALHRRMTAHRTRRTTSSAGRSCRAPVGAVCRRAAARGSARRIAAPRRAGGTPASWRLRDHPECLDLGGPERSVAGCHVYVEQTGVAAARDDVDGVRSTGLAAEDGELARDAGDLGGAGAGGVGVGVGVGVAQLSQGFLDRGFVPILGHRDRVAKTHAGPRIPRSGPATRPVADSTDLCPCPDFRSSQAIGSSIHSIRAGQRTASRRKARIA